MNVAIALQLIVQMLTQVKELAAMISQANQQGRDLTQEELAGLVDRDVAARNSLQAAINAVRNPPVEE